MKYKTRFLLFFAGVSLFNMAASFVHPVTPTLIKELGLHDYMFGVALACMYITNFLFSPFWGKINSYIPAKVSLFICCVGYGIAQIWFACSATEFMIVCARLFAGIFTGGIFVSFLTYILNKAKPEDQGKYLTVNATIKSVGSAFGYLIGGLLGEISTRFCFIAQAASLIFAGILFFIICEPEKKTSPARLSTKEFAKEVNPFQAFIDSRKFMCTAFALLFIINILTNIGNTGFDQAFNYYLKDALNLTSSYNGIIKAFVGLITLVANSTLCVWIINKTKVDHSFTVIVAVCAAASLGTALVPQIGIFIALSVLVYAGYSVSVPVLQSIIAGLAKPNDQNLVMGFFNATVSLGGIIGSMTVGFIYTLNAKLPFTLSFVIYTCALIAAFGFILYGRKKKS